MLHCVDKAMLYAIVMTLGKRIKAARERLKPTVRQRDIGDAFGITDKAVSSWERDESIPDLDKIGKLARLLQVPIAWLIEGAGAPPPPDHLYVRIEALEPAERAMLTAIIDALPKRRGKVA